MNQPVSPEFLQWEVTPKKMSKAILEILNSPEKQSQMKETYKTLKKKLGAKGSAKRAATFIQEFVK